jgi:membrane-associated phospholipid phosphatase
MLFGNYWGTQYIVAADQFIFGVHPTIWVQQFYRPWLDEAISIFYISYYGIISITLIGLIIRKKLSDLHWALSIISVTYFTNFLIFIIIPVLGPQMTSALQELSHDTYSGFFVSDLLKQMQLNGGVRGGAFPSSHVSGGLVWTLICFKYFKKIGIFMIPFMAGITVATVYLGYHHAMDTITGLLWGIMSYHLTNFWLVRKAITNKAERHSASSGRAFSET